MAAAIEVNAPFLGVDSDSEEEDEEIVPTTAVSRARSSAPPLPKAIITSRGADIPTPTSVKRRQSLGGLALSTAFTEAQLLSASDRFRDAWSKVQAHEWDVRSWAALLSEAQTQRSGRAIALRDVYRLATRQFPTKVSLWKDWLEHELRQGNLAQVDDIFRECLLEVPSVDLYLLYVARVRKTNPASLGDGASPEAVAEQRARVTAAFELGVRQVGVLVDAAPLWWDYIRYVEAWKDEGGRDGGGEGGFGGGYGGIAVAEAGSQIATLRRIYHRAVLVPVDGLDELWRAYEAWERGLNEHTARQTLPQLLPGHQQAKTVARERRTIRDLQRLSSWATPPSHTAEEKEQLHYLRRKIDFEKNNPENVDPVALKDRVRLSYRQAFAYFYHFPEVWYEFAAYEQESDDVVAAASLFARAARAVPDCLLLHLAWAELEDGRGRGDKGAEILKGFLIQEPSTLGYVAYQHYVRRTQGKEAARKVFTATKDLRRKGVLTYHWYLAHAQLEEHVNHEPQVARRVLDHGLSLHSSFLTEPEYVVATMEVLIRLQDEQNVRSLADRALAVLEAGVSAGPGAGGEREEVATAAAAMAAAEKARPVWFKLLEFETCVASDRDPARVERVQQRIAEAFPRQAESHPLLRLWRRLNMFGTPPVEDSSDDLLRQRWEEPAVSYRLLDDGERDGRGMGGGRRGRKSGKGGASSAAGGEVTVGAGDDGGGGREGGREGGGDGVGGGDGGVDGEGQPAVSREARRRDDPYGARALQQRRLQSIPEYLRKLYQMLPIHTGPPIDPDTIIRGLRDNPLPPRPPGQSSGGSKMLGNGEGGERGKGRGRKRGRWGGGGDSDSGDSDDDMMRSGAGDVFRQRQQQKLMAGT
ncbi:hypothetical protein NSK_007960 [Nannochloropsis salina CCMP1776]|uniref:Suppressor of forked domain-containing protein n=1 Tax=Nannochloropsis salina CCMP1776 TaxID=1027361 RepID=A0A4D9CTB6_9STRA|nr:hypothetical protein NSK_007960 [Nannochloropsis salina CCMP1776]|eukprot:TFJ80783.1 hypothetical protein NSK_007960 [Nannochloropsis salina CCMP1776]